MVIPCPLKLAACTSQLIIPPPTSCCAIKSDNNKVTWQLSFGTCQYLEAGGKCLFSAVFFLFLTSQSPILLSISSFQLRILPYPPSLSPHLRHLPFFSFRSYSSQHLQPLYIGAGILHINGLVWYGKVLQDCKCVIILISLHLPVRRNCFHFQHSHHIERVCSALCHGNIE